MKNFAQNNEIEIIIIPGSVLMGPKLGFLTISNQSKSIRDSDNLQYLISTWTITLLFVNCLVSVNFENYQYLF